MNYIVSLVCGLIFGLGLTISEMVNPQKVLNFLDIAGAWDPSLAFVMGGGLVVFGLGYLVLIRPRQKALDGTSIPEVSKAPIDKKLFTGSILFGIGWGMSGVCPGPAIANASSFDPMMLTFIGCMIVGLMIGTKIKEMA